MLQKLASEIGSITDATQRQSTMLEVVHQHKKNWGQSLESEFIPMVPISGTSFWSMCQGGALQTLVTLLKSVFHWYCNWDTWTSYVTCDADEYIPVCYDTQQLWQQNVCSRWTSFVELSSSPAEQSRHHLRTVQTTAEETSFSGSMDAVLCDF